MLESVVLCVCFHYHARTQLAVILLCSFLILSQTRFVLGTHFFSAVQVHLIHLKWNEWQAVSAVKSEIRLGVKEMLSVYKI